MSKYSALTTFLSSRTQPKISMSFEDIERIVGSKLPQSAFNHRAWWSNNPTNSVMTKAWLAAGFRSEDVDMTARKLVFSRQVALSPSGGTNRVAPASTGSPLAGLFGGLKGTLHIEAGTDLTLPSTAPIYLYSGSEAEPPLEEADPTVQPLWRSGDTTEFGISDQENSPSLRRNFSEES